MKERRKHTRANKYFIIKFRNRKFNVPTRSFDRWDVVITHNLSAGGAFFQYNGEIKIGALLDLSIYFPAFKVPMKCVGEVIRVQGKPGSPSIAVQFIEMDENEKYMINKVARDFYADEFEPDTLSK